MNKQEMDNLIVTTYKKLLLKDEKKYKEAYNNLTALFFELPKGFEYNYTDMLEQWQVIQAITLSIIKGFVEDNETLKLTAIRTVYNKLKAQVGEHIKTQEDLYIFQLCDEDFTKKLQKLILKLK